MAAAPQLLGSSWLVAAAIISSNAWFGRLNSWIMGMILFWVMFHYGLWIAILIHILYDLAHDATHTIMAALQPPARPSLRDLALARFIKR